MMTPKKKEPRKYKKKKHGAQGIKGFLFFFIFFIFLFFFYFFFFLPGIRITHLTKNDCAVFPGFVFAPLVWLGCKMNIKRAD